MRFKKFNEYRASRRLTLNDLSLWLKKGDKITLDFGVDYYFEYYDPSTNLLHVSDFGGEKRSFSLDELNITAINDEDVIITEKKSK